MKPIAQITEIENGWVVQLPPKQTYLRSQTEQPVPRSVYCKDFEEVCNALKGEFPPSIVG